MLHLNRKQKAYHICDSPRLEKEPTGNLCMRGNVQKPPWISKTSCSIHWQWVSVGVTSFPPCAPAALSAQATDTGMRTTEVACHPAVKWTETESETVSESWIESGTETESENGTGIETEAGTENENGTEKETETEAESGIENATGNGTETERDRSDVSNHFLLRLYKEWRQRCKYLYKWDTYCKLFFSMFSLSGSDSYPERRGVRKGNTVYVYGSGLAEDSLRSAFSQHGNIIDLSMDNPRKYGTIKQRCVHIVVISTYCYECVAVLLIYSTVFSCFCFILWYCCDLFLFVVAHLSRLRRWSLQTRL